MCIRDRVSTQSTWAGGNVCEVSLEGAAVSAIFSLAEKHRQSPGLGIEGVDLLAGQADDIAGVQAQQFIERPAFAGGRGAGENATAARRCAHVPVGQTAGPLDILEHAGDAFFDGGGDSAEVVAGDELVPALVGGDSEGAAIAQPEGDEPVIDGVAATRDLEVDGRIGAGVFRGEGGPLLSAGEDVAAERLRGERNAGSEQPVLAECAFHQLGQLVEGVGIVNVGVDAIVGTHQATGMRIPQVPGLMAHAGRGGEGGGIRLMRGAAGGDKQSEGK
eukprot:TRINITY_DN19131_c0_g1_i2.p2 TRINITY_DN19131_c0_g1~~TRINITY_DN19131_c0_g1_i2.p2  ORF type:complete len:275 (-),score=39.75 TRINITY_DN19131_c0_g1_i2:554-1378(-)